MSTATRIFLYTACFTIMAIGEMRPQDPSPVIKKTARYDIVWETPSKDHTGSMPLGNGDLSVNCWVEDSGDLIFYIGKTDSWDDNGRLLKVGRVRIQLDPPPLTPLEQFQQKLSLVDGTFTVRFRAGNKTISMQLWVDANHPVIEVDIKSDHSIAASASIEMWRTKKDTLASIEVSDTFCDANGPPRGMTVVEPDVLLAKPSGGIGWYHHNGKSVGPAISARLQGLQDFPRPDPLLHRTFGAVISAPGSRRLDDRRLALPPSDHHRISTYVVTQHPALPGQWQSTVDSVIAKTEAVPQHHRRKAHARWWEEFWNRSWIHVHAGGGASRKDTDDAFLVSRSYALQRFIAACAGRGKYPIKFNGSIFTVPAAGRPGDADYRQWGPGYWWQNTRLPYASMCTSGDWDLIQPLFTMYAQELMPLFRYRTRLYLHHGGAFIPECILFWGDLFNEVYGWTPYEQRSDKLQENRYHKWEWVSGPELVFLMLDYYDHTLDADFLSRTLLPTAHEILTFFDEHYATDAKGKLLMSPSQACETWWECTNPMPEIAGLHAVLERLSALPGSLTTPQLRRFWSMLRNKMPDLPTRTVEGVTMLAPAAIFANKQNIENPELYAVYPFRLVAFEKSNRELGSAALEHREDRGAFGWRQDDIFMAYMGMADSAKEYVVTRAGKSHPESRFPAFWGPNYDWVPDQDHGSVLLKTLQAMLLQSDGRTCYLLPAWPKAWNVDFKLHAPFNTTIAGEVQNGKIVRLSTVPETRSADIVVLTPRK